MLVFDVSCLGNVLAVLVTVVTGHYGNWWLAAVTDYDDDGDDGGRVFRDQ